MKNAAMKNYRQGDVLFTRIPKLPRGERKKREDATVAYGEVTGHSHALALEDREAAEVLEIGEGLFVHVSEAGVRLHNNVRASVVDAYGNTVWLPGEVRGVAFIHQEHDTAVLPPGEYEVTIQREYAPQAIRNVQD